MIRVLLVDDQKTVRETLKISLESVTDIEVVGTANNGIAAIEQVEALHPDIAIMNMEMPGLDGASATKQITSRFSETKVLILTSYDTDEYVTKSLAMGAKGYLLKNIEAQDLAGAIRNVYKGYTQIAPGLLEKLLVCTDSGVVISKLKGLSTTSKSTTGMTSGATKPQKAISSLQLTSRQQQEEIAKLKQSIDNNQQELPKIKQNLASNNRHIWLVSLFWLISLFIFGIYLFRLNHKTHNMELSVIPMERIGLQGEFSMSGIAQRVNKAFAEDPILRDITTVYVAQEEDAIVLTGMISDANLLRRMENIARQIVGVNRVYSSQVDVQPDFTVQILDSEQSIAD